MSFDAPGLREAIARHGAVARVLVVETAGSVPRQTGTTMLVWDGGQDGTIGGGALEFAAVMNARKLLADSGEKVSRYPLGPSLGQCCGGAVTLVTEAWDASLLDALTEGPVVRRVDGTAPQPVALRRALRDERNSGQTPEIRLEAGWLIEPRTADPRTLWVFGAGHVGRALVDVLSPLPGVALTWVDTGPERFPETVPNGVAQLVAKRPADAVRHAPCSAEHLVLTYSHALDLEICDALLRHQFSSVGLIGSKTKWARFRKRLQELGHTSEKVSRIDCPIGDPTLGKHPQAIAIGVAMRVLHRDSATVSKVRSA